MKMEKVLRVGDTVQWSGGWGRDASKDARVIGIEIVVPGEKYGVAVREVEWERMAEVVVDLDNSHFAYGYQISPKEGK